jgi:hypothetical protein
VYVPPDGSTHSGTSLGIHFFNDDQVVDAAIERGHLFGGKADSSLAQGDENQSENEWGVGQEEQENGEERPLDDSKLVGKSEFITLESGRLSAVLVASFMKENQDSVSFQGALFNPLWQRLKLQGADSNLNWRYERTSGNDSMLRTWCYVPPSSDLGSKGRRGSDFFLTEEEVVLIVLEEALKVRDLSSWFKKSKSSISSLIAILTRSVQNNMVSSNCFAIHTEPPLNSYH